MREVTGSAAGHWEEAAPRHSLMGFHLCFQRQQPPSPAEQRPSGKGSASSLASSTPVCKHAGDPLQGARAPDSPSHPPLEGRAWAPLLTGLGTSWAKKLRQQLAGQAPSFWGLTQQHLPLPALATQADPPSHGHKTSPTPGHERVPQTGHPQPQSEPHKHHPGDSLEVGGAEGAQQGPNSSLSR